MADVNVTMYTTPYGIPGPRGSNADPTVDFARESTLTSMLSAINTLTTSINSLQTTMPTTSIGGLTLSSRLVTINSTWPL
jgi:hypothetical protein